MSAYDITGFLHTRSVPTLCGLHTKSKTPLNTAYQKLGWGVGVSPSTLYVPVLQDNGDTTCLPQSQQLVGGEWWNAHTWLHHTFTLTWTPQAAATALNNINLCEIITSWTTCNNQWQFWTMRREVRPSKKSCVSGNHLNKMLLGSSYFFS